MTLVSAPLCHSVCARSQEDMEIHIGEWQNLIGEHRYRRARTLRTMPSHRLKPACRVAVPRDTLSDSCCCETGSYAESDLG